MANAYTTLVGLNHLNYYMKDYPSGIIVESDFVWPDRIYDALKSRVDAREHKGNLVEIEMQTDYDFSGQAFGERVSLPYAGSPAFVKMQLPLKEVIVPAGITQQALDRATGGDNSWGPIVDREIQQVKSMRFPWLMEICAMGDGTGRLARGMNTTDGSDPVTSGRLRICCDNTYTDFGWENVRFIKKGMWVQIYNGSGAKAEDSSAVDAWKVTNVWFGDRSNSTAVTPATTNGSEVACFEIAVTAGQEATIAAFADDHSTIYLANTRSISSSTPDSVDATAKYEATNYVGSVDVTTSLPMGLTGIFQTTDTDYDYYSGADYTLDTFQGLTRSSYDTLNTKFFNGTDITGGSGAAGTPGDWDFSVISDAWLDRYQATNSEIDVLLASPKLSMCMDRKNTITVTVDQIKDNYQILPGVQYAKPFRAPNGKLIPVVISPSIPDNVLYGINTKHLHWFNRGGFDFKPWGNGDIWMLSPGNRYAVYEAWYGGYSQLAAERCDSAFVIQDLATNVS